MEKELLNEILSKFDLGDDAFIIIPIKSKSEAKDEPEPVVEPEPKKSSKKEVIIDAPEREDVRQALLNAKRAGIKVKDIMSKYVPEGKDSKFDNVPISSYEALMKEIADYAV